MGSEVCGFHPCGKCSIFMLVFGVIYILISLKVSVFAGVDPWLVLGVFLALMGLEPYLMGGKK